MRAGVELLVQNLASKQWHPFLGPQTLFITTAATFWCPPTWHVAHTEPPLSNSLVGKRKKMRFRSLSRATVPEEADWRFKPSFPVPGPTLPPHQGLTHRPSSGEDVPPPPGASWHHLPLSDHCLPFQLFQIPQGSGRRELSMTHSGMIKSVGLCLCSHYKPDPPGSIIPQPPLTQPN